MYFSALSKTESKNMKELICRVLCAVCNHQVQCTLTYDLNRYDMYCSIIWTGTTCTVQPFSLIFFQVTKSDYTEHKIQIWPIKFGLKNLITERKWISSLDNGVKILQSIGDLQFCQLITDSQRYPLNLYLNNNG